MKLMNKLVCLLSCGLIILSGCKKELDRQPIDSFSDANAFQTIVHVQMGANAAYGRYSAYFNDMWVNTLLSDEAKIGPGNTGFGVQTYRWQFGTDNNIDADVTSAYYDYYRMIDQINRVLPHIDKVAALPSEEPRRNIIKGQLLALRAIGHFSLLEMYADRYDPAKPGVPVMLQSCVTCNPPRNTMGEVMAQIDKDFAEALTLLPAVTVTSFSDTVMNPINIKAYQARIALYKRDYSKAVEYSTAVISSNVKPLAFGNGFNGIWTDANTNEVLFRRRYENVNDGSIGEAYTTTGGNVIIQPSDKLVNSYSSTDIRLAAYIGTTSGGDRVINKFFTSTKGGRVFDIKAIRTAEMYLIRAEAYAKSATPDLAAGSADLNTLRSNRIGGYVPVTYTTAATLIDAVLTERFKELAFEGFRWFDLKRNFLPVERSATDASPLWQTLPSDSYRWLLPIPRQEIIANPNTVQNPGYVN